jgi:hypothetical protein
LVLTFCAVFNAVKVCTWFYSLSLAKGKEDKSNIYRCKNFWASQKIAISEWRKKETQLKIEEI